VPKTVVTLADDFTQMADQPFPDGALRVDQGLEDGLIAHTSQRLTEVRQAQSIGCFVSG
jgi:hypothetical protein